MEALIEILNALAELSAMCVLLAPVIGVFVVTGWGLCELAVEFLKEPPDEGINYVPSHLSEILMRSFKDDLANIALPSVPVPKRKPGRDYESTRDPIRPLHESGVPLTDAHEPLADISRPSSGRKSAEEDLDGG